MDSGDTHTAWRLEGKQVQCAFVVCSVSVQCAVRNVQCSVYCLVCSNQYAVCTCAVCRVQCSVCRVQCSVFSVQCSVCSVQCAVCSVKFKVCSVQCAPQGDDHPLSTGYWTHGQLPLSSDWDYAVYIIGRNPALLYFITIQCTVMSCIR